MKLSGFERKAVGKAIFGFAISLICANMASCGPTSEINIPSTNAPAPSWSKPTPTPEPVPAPSPTPDPTPSSPTPPSPTTPPDNAPPSSGSRYLRIFCQANPPTPLVTFTSLASAHDVASPIQVQFGDPTRVQFIKSLRGPQLRRANERQASVLVAGALEEPRGSSPTPALYNVDIDLVEKRGTAKWITSLPPQFEHYEAVANVLKLPLRSWAVLSQSRVLIAHHKTKFSYVVLNVNTGKIEKTISSLGAEPLWNPTHYLNGNAVVFDVFDRQALSVRQIGLRLKPSPQFFDPATYSNAQRQWGLHPLGSNQWFWLEKRTNAIVAVLYQQGRNKVSSWVISKDLDLVVSFPERAIQVNQTGITTLVLVAEKISKDTNGTNHVELAEIQTYRVSGNRLTLIRSTPYDASIIRHIEGLGRILGAPPFVNQLKISPLNLDTYYATLPSSSGYSLYEIDPTRGFNPITVSTCLNPSWQEVKP